jgi:phage gp36-like protein
MTVVAYAQVSDVRIAVSRDSNRPRNTAAEMSDEHIQAALDNAQAEIDAKLRHRYTTPFLPTPLLVKSVTIDIAAYLATINFRQERNIPDGDATVRRWMRACCLLDDLAKGVANLDVGDGSGDPAPSTTSGMGRPIAPAIGPLFSPRTMFGRRGDPGGWFW